MSLTAAAKVRELEKLKLSVGYTILTDKMREEIQQVCEGLGAAESIPADVIHFRRGLIAAAMGHISVLDNLILALKAEAAMDDPDGVTSDLNNSPAKAGTEN